MCEYIKYLCYQEIVTEVNPRAATQECWTLRAKHLWWATLPLWEGWINVDWLKRHMYLCTGCTEHFQTPGRLKKDSFRLRSWVSCAVTLHNKGGAQWRPQPASAFEEHRAEGGRWVLVYTDAFSFLAVFQTEIISEESQFGLTYMPLFHSQGWVIVNWIEEADSSNKGKIKTVKQNKAEKASYTPRYTPIGIHLITTMVMIYSGRVETNRGLQITLKELLNSTPKYVQHNIQAIWSTAFFFFN